MATAPQSSRTSTLRLRPARREADKEVKDGEIELDSFDFSSGAVGKRDGNQDSKSANDEVPLERKDTFQPQVSADQAQSYTNEALATSQAYPHAVGPRDYPWARTVSEVLDSTVWKFCSLFAILVALFALDFTTAVLPKSVDESTFVIIFIAFLFLCVEILTTSIVKKNYVGSFFFWLDIVGTLSIITDVPWLLGNQESSSTNDDLTVARASRVSRVARSAGTLRMTRLFRIFRVVRMVRVVKLLKLFGAKDRAEATDRRPSKIGLRLVDEISKRVILMVLLMIIVTPLLDSSPIDNGEGKILGLAMLQASQNATDLTTNTQNFVSFYFNELLFLQVQGSVNVPLKEETFDLRNREISKFRLRDTSGTVVTEAWFTIRDLVLLEAAFSITLTLVIIVAFGIGTVVMSRDARRLVVAPIERMTFIVRKLANTVCLLSTDEQNPSKPGADDGYETTVIESLVDRMADIFSVPKDDGVNVEVLSRDGHDRSLSDLSATDASDSESDTGLSRPHNHKRLLRDHPELASFETILQHPKGRVRFQEFVNADLSLENLLFWRETQAYTNYIEETAARIYRQFIRDSAANRILIDPSIVRVIRSSVENGPWIGTFENAQWEVYEQLQRTFKRFMGSSFLLTYLREKEEG